MKSYESNHKTSEKKVKEKKIKEIGTEKSELFVSLICQLVWCES